MLIRLLALVSISLIGGGCAFSVYDLPIHYEYAGDVPRIERTDLPALDVGEIKDTRSVANPRMIMHQKNGYGQTTSGGWQAEKDLAVIVQDALVQGIVATGLDGPRASRLTLTGELNDVTSEVVMGWVSGTLRVKMTVKLEASDPATGEIVWRDTFISAGEAQGGTVSKTLGTAFKGALDDLLRSLFTDQYFLQQVSRALVGPDPA